MTTDLDSLHISESFLIAEIGHTTTTVCLFDIVEGGYRFISRAQAPTTIQAPWVNVSHGVQQAIAKLNKITKRNFLDNQGSLIVPEGEDGSGVDHFALITSATDPLNVLTIGLLDEVSLISVRRALQSTYVREVDCFSLSDNRDLQAQVSVTINKKPDLIFITGGTDGGDSQRVLKLADFVRLCIDLLTQHGLPLPRVIYAGNHDVYEQIQELLDDKVVLHIVDNVRPQLDQENLSDTVNLLSELYQDIKIDHIQGIDEVSAWSEYPVIPTIEGLTKINQYFSALSRGQVLCFDIGSNNSVFIASKPNQTRLSVQSDYGIGKPISNLLKPSTLEYILQWAEDSNTNLDTIRNFIHNKALYPQTAPNTETELYLEQAIIRSILHEVVTSAISDWSEQASKLLNTNLILVRGSVFSYTPRPSQVVLMLLDAVQPSGIFAISVDKYGVLPALGLMSAHKPLITVQSLEGGVLHDLGWVIAPIGHAQQGQVVLNLELELEDSTLKAEVAYGSLEVLPLPAGQTAQLTVKPVSRRIDIGYGPGKAKKLKIHGGSVGLIIDARGRPLTLPKDSNERQELIRQWRWDVGG